MRYLSPLFHQHAPLYATPQAIEMELEARLSPVRLAAQPTLRRLADQAAAGMAATAVEDTNPTARKRSRISRAGLALDVGGGGGGDAASPAGAEGARVSLPGSPGGAVTRPQRGWGARRRAMEAAALKEKEAKQEVGLLTVLEAAVAAKGGAGGTFEIACPRISGGGVLLRRPGTSRLGQRSSRSAIEAAGGVLDGEGDGNAAHHDDGDTFAELLRLATPVAGAARMGAPAAEGPSAGSGAAAALAAMQSTRELAGALAAALPSLPPPKRGRRGGGGGP